MASSNRMLWEFHGPLICRVLGLAFTDEEQGKILKRMIPGAQTLTASQVHAVLVQLCTQQNPVSKYMDEMLEEHFAPFRKQLAGLDQQEISRRIERETGYLDVPLSALIWYALRYRHQDIDKIETRVFSAIHAMEHRALRLYDNLTRVLPDNKPEDVLEKLKVGMRLNDEFQKRYDRSQHKNEELRGELEKVKKDRLRLVEALGEQRQRNERLSRDIENLGGQSALDQMERIKKEKDLLAQEVGSLMQELLKKQPGTADNEPTGCSSCSGLKAEEKNIYASPGLNGKRVAFIGGLESFAPHYQEVVEHLNGTFYFHSGNCTGGRGELEKLVGKADVVFCPVDINSHHACRHVKKACKLTGKPCCFLRSSGLSTFRRELSQFAGKVN